MCNWLKKRCYFAIQALMILMAVGVFSACSNYTLGGSKSPAFKDIETVYVEVFRNNTYYPRAEVLLTSAIVEELDSNGTFTSAASGDSDCTLRGSIRSISLEQVRSHPMNTYRSLETMMRISIDYQVISNLDGKILRSGSVNVNPSYFNLGKQNSSKSDALSLGARMAAYRIVSEMVY